MRPSRALRGPSASRTFAGRVPVVEGSTVAVAARGRPPAQKFAPVQRVCDIEPGLHGIATTSVAKLTAYGPPEYAACNGPAHQDAGHPIKLTAGPDPWTSFHMIGTIFERASGDGNWANCLRGLQSMSNGPAGVPPSSSR